MKYIALAALALLLIGCDEFKDPNKQTDYENGKPVEVTTVFDCPIFAKRVVFKGEKRNIFVTYCPRVKSINWQDSGKHVQRHTWINDNTAE